MKWALGCQCWNSPWGVSVEIVPGVSVFELVLWGVSVEIVPAVSVLK